MNKTIFALLAIVTGFVLSGCSSNGAADSGEVVHGAPPGAQPAAGRSSTAPTQAASQGQSHSTTQ